VETTPHANDASDVIQVSGDLALRPIADGVWMHTSWAELPGLGRVPSNGLVVVGVRDALLVDTAWGEVPTVALLDYVEGTLGRHVTDVLLTHSHDDRVEGVRVVLDRSARVHALELTATRMVAGGYPPPTHPFESEASLQVDGVRVEAFFPGAAHAPDNVVVWLPATGVLFGSCMLRAQDWTLGNLEDASLTTWSSALDAIVARVPAPRVVVPGHGDPGGPELIEHTRALVRAARSLH
jgi:glyoxylase-like metal-dependent hydrolase (beta-lactamase superfamily II)